MFKTPFSSAILRLLCFVAFALCFGATANAQQNTISLFSPSAGERVEGNTQTFRLQLRRPATQRLTVRVDTGEGTAFEAARPDGRPADYVGFHGDVTFDVGLDQVSIRIGTIGDNRYEFNESFGINVSNPRYNGNATTQAQVNFADPDPFNPNSASAGTSIVDNDSPPTLTLQRPSTTLEGDTQVNTRVVVPIIVDIDVPAERPLMVAFDTSDNGTQPGSMAGTATAGQDYEAITNDLVTIPANATQYIYQPGGTNANPDPAAQGVTILGDDSYEGDEAFTLTIRYSPNLVNTTPSSTVITIQDNDLPTYTITGGRAFEGSNIPFVVTLVDGDTAQPVAARSAITFNYTLDGSGLNGSATFGADFTNPGFGGNSGSFVIPIGSSSATINIPILNDDIAENVETFNFRIVSVSGAVNASDNIAVGTIDNLNNDPVISIADASVTEGTNGVTNLVFTVSLSNSSTQQVTVQYETLTDNTVPAAQRATSGVDFAARTGTVIFPAVAGTSGPANTTQTFSIPITTDSINEQNETFRVRLFNPAGGFASFPNSAPEIFANGTIIDDDSAGTVSVRTNNATVREDIAGGIINVIVNFVPNGTPARPVTVDFTTIPGTALQSGQRDYFGKTGRVTFQPRSGNASLAIPIEIVNDDIREGDESFTVRLTAVDGATLNVGDPNATDTVVTIIDNDPLPVVSVFPASPIREDGGVKNFVIAITGKSQVPVTVNYAFGADGDTATAGLDYVAVNDDNPLTGSRTFTLGGPVSYFVPVRIVQDNIAEGNETFSLVLSKGANDTSFALSPTGTTSVATIVDEDLTPSLNIGDAQILEGSGDDVTTGAVLNFPVTLTRPSSRPVTFTYSTFNLRQANCTPANDMAANGTPANGCDVASNGDYTSVRNVAVTIPAGETTATITIRVTPDTLNEFNEQFAVVARSLVNAVPSFTAATDSSEQRFGTTAFGTIVNDDPGGVITLSGPFTDATGTTLTGNLVENYKRNATDLFVGNVANFRVTLPTPASRSVTVNYTIQGSVQDSDISDITSGPGKTGALKGSVTFFAGDTTRNIVLRAAADNEKENLETLRVTIAITDNNGNNSYTTATASSSAATNIVDRTPAVASFTPAVGFPAYGNVAASQVRINGSLLRTDGNPRVSSVIFSGGAQVGPGGIQYTSDNSIVVSVPNTAKSGPITLRLADGQVTMQGQTTTDGRTILTFPASTGTDTPNFTVQPVIQSFTPDTGVRGATTITINGRNFQDGNNAVTGVQFNNGTPVNVPVGDILSDTQLRVRVPADATTGPLRIVSRQSTNPASQTNFTVVTAAAGSIAFVNPDLNPILEGSTGTFETPVRNFNGTANGAPHGRYQLFVNPATQTSGANSGQAVAQTPITVTFRVTDNTNTGREPKVTVRGDLTGAGRSTFNQTSGTDGTVVVNIPASYNRANPLEVAIVDAGTDTAPPVVGTTGAATVSVTARITASENPTFFATTPSNQVPFVTVERREVVTNTNQTVVAFAANSTSTFSVPFSSSSSGSVPISTAFETPPTTMVNGAEVRNYTIYRFDAANQLNNRANGADFKALEDTDSLQRGVGYRIVTGAQEVRLKARGSNLQTTSATNFAINLTRNVPFAANASGSANANNGYNFIGFPFNNTAFSGVNFNNTTVTFNGTTRSLSDAAAAGLINSQLYTLGANGAITPVTGTPIIEPFKAYFVQIFRDNLTINLDSPTR